MWSGLWRNQYGSILELANDERDGSISGWFTSAVDGGIKGQRLRVAGLCAGDRITFCVAGGAIAAAWTGLLRNGRMETLWHVAASERAPKGTLGIFEAFTTGADTFVRAER